MQSTDGRGIGSLAARAALLNGQQAQPTVGALVGDRVVAHLAEDFIGSRKLPAGLADMQQYRRRSCRRALLVIAEIGAVVRIIERITRVQRAWRCRVAAIRAATSRREFLSVNCPFCASANRWWDE